MVVKSVLPFQVLCRRVRKSYVSVEELEGSPDCPRPRLVASPLSPLCDRGSGRSFSRSWERRDSGKRRGWARRPHSTEPYRVVEKEEKTRRRPANGMRKRGVHASRERRLHLLHLVQPVNRWVEGVVWIGGLERHRFPGVPIRDRSLEQAREVFWADTRLGERKRIGPHGPEEVDFGAA